MDRKGLEYHIRGLYGISADYPWERYPDYAVFRHRDNGKWFAVLMRISASKLGMDSYEEIDVVNLKWDGIFSETLWASLAIYPAYHMNKQHWITVVLRDITDRDLRGLLQKSFILTEKKRG